MQHLIYKYLLIVSACCLACASPAQQKTERTYLRSGNRLYRDSMYTKAEVDYRKAIEKNNRLPQSHYNLGNALLMQQKPKDAMEAYEQAAKLEEANKKRLASIYHNMGVILQSQKQFAQAIECYKNALRKNPAKDESRYNLVLCQHQLKNDDQQGGNGGSDNNQGNDQNQNKDDESDKKDQNQEQKQQDKKEEQQQQPKEEQDKMSKENAEQLLNAAMQDEKNTQERLKKALNQPQRRKLEKQW